MLLIRVPLPKCDLSPAHATYAHAPQRRIRKADRREHNTTDTVRLKDKHDMRVMVMMTMMMMTTDACLLAFFQMCPSRGADTLYDEGRVSLDRRNVRRFKNMPVPLAVAMGDSQYSNSHSVHAGGWTCTVFFLFSSPGSKANLREFCICDFSS